MLTNRITNHLPAENAEPAVAHSPSFAAVPSFFPAVAGQPNASANDIYRLAHEAAQQQVAARRELIVNRIRRYLSN